MIAAAAEGATARAASPAATPPPAIVITWVNPFGAFGASGFFAKTLASTDRRCSGERPLRAFRTFFSASFTTFGSEALVAAAVLLIFHSPLLQLSRHRRGVRTPRARYS